MICNLGVVGSNPTRGSKDELGSSGFSERDDGSQFGSHGGEELEEELRIKHLCSEYCSLFDFNSLFEILRANTRVAKWGRL